MHDSLNTTPGRPLDSTTAHTRRHTRHTAAHTSCANESRKPQTKGCSLGIDSETAGRLTSSTPSPARHRAAGGSQAAICERRRAMRRVSRGSGERCSKHRQCSRKSPLGANQLRVARVRFEDHVLRDRLESARTAALGARTTGGASHKRRTNSAAKEPPQGNVRRWR